MQLYKGVSFENLTKDNHIENNNISKDEFDELLKKDPFGNMLDINKFNSFKYYELTDREYVIAFFNEENKEYKWMSYEDFKKAHYEKPMD
jgi:hypothetical protein